MAANVLFKKSTAEKYQALEAKVSTTFYYTTDDSQLYLGSVKLSNANEIAAAVVRIAKNETDIKDLKDAMDIVRGDDTVSGSIKQQVKAAQDALDLKIGTLGNLITTKKGNLVEAINEVYAAVGAGGTAAAVTLTTLATPSADMAKTYQLKQGENVVGVIDIPKDMVVESGEVVTFTDDNRPAEVAENGTYIVLTLANTNNDKIYLNVGRLVDIYKAKENATQVQLAIDSTTREISASIVAGSIGTTELADEAVTSNKIVENAIVEKHILADSVTESKIKAGAVTEGKIGTGAVTEEKLGTGAVTTNKIADGNVTLAKLGTDAVAAFDAAGSAAVAEQNAKNYADTEIGEAKTEVKGYTDTQVAEAKTYAEEQAATAEENAVSTAKDYTDAEVGKAKTFATEEATAKANAAQSAAIEAAATDATNKANSAKEAAIAAASSDATTKADNAKSEAISAAATDATTKAGNAKSEAIAAAAADATSKADAAQAAAISAAATDAQTKADKAKTDAVSESKTYIEGLLTWEEL